MRRYRLGGMVLRGAVFIRTGEFRPPRKGEHYLSGAVPEAWFAPNDLADAYHILVPVPERRAGGRRGRP